MAAITVINNSDKIHHWLINQCRVNGALGEIGHFHRLKVSFQINSLGKNYFFILILFLFFFRAAHTPYGDSQARGRIGAVAYTTATATPNPSCI